MQRAVSLIIAIVFALNVQSQNNWLSGEKPSFSAGPYLKTNGFGLSSEFSILQEQRNQFGVHLSLSNLKHSKEVKVQNGIIPNPIPYVYGKAKRALQFNTAWAWLRETSVNSNHSPRLFTGFEVGPSIAILRPVQVYFLELDQQENPRQVLRKYDQNVHAQQEYILGDGGWTKGFSDLEINIGIHSAIYLQLDGERDFRYRGLRAGLSIDYYPKDLGILYNNDNRLFGSLFLSYQFGSYN